MSIQDNIKRIQKDIEKSATSFGRNPSDVTLIAVSKKQPDERIRAALELGHRVFGENRVQEALERWSERRYQYSDLKLHLIGPLQTNKVKEAVALFDVIEIVDREKLVKALSSEIQKQGKDVTCLIQVNTGEESQKSGVLPENLESLLALCKAEGLKISGLMCIPPVDEAAGVHFAFLKTLADRHGLKILSMGMSSDYKEAIASGATHIRVGSAVFGARQ
ncbi:MAG: YggS family pyridoxal phosphate-dependent enzyme [Pseudomonadota bacterium]